MKGSVWPTRFHEGGLHFGGEDGPVGHEVRVRAGVRLDVGVLRTEEVPGKLDGASLDGVDVLAPGVEAVVGVALGVLIGEEVAHGELDGEGGVVLRGDHLEAVGLVVELCDDGGRDLWRDGPDVFERCEAGDEPGVQVASGGGRLGDVVGEG